MKIAVISDVHGNVPALEAVLDDIERWGPDRLVVAGDLINRGPCSLACFELLEARAPGYRAIQGNHEGFVLRCADRVQDPGDVQGDLSRFAQFTAEQMGEALAPIRIWPHHLDIDDPDAGTVHVTHGSRLGNREGILPDTDGEALAERIGDPRDLFIAAHTHRPLVKHFRGTLIVNVGSVGTPFDRDPRAAYGRLHFAEGRWHADIVRLDFDRARHERNFETSGFLEQGGALARIMLTEFRQSRGHMGPWMRRYHDRVRAGEMALDAAVDEYLAGVQ